jgi:hypothetical protein
MDNGQKAIALYADTITGVMTHGDDGFVTEIISNEDVFYSHLKDLSQGEYIKCEVSLSMYKKIDDEYGVHKK